MGSLAVLMKKGLFQMNGGTEEDPIYEFGKSPFLISVMSIELLFHPDIILESTF